MNKGTFETFAQAALTIANMLYSDEDRTTLLSVKCERQFFEKGWVEGRGSSYVALVVDATHPGEEPTVAYCESDNEDDAVMGLLKKLAEEAAKRGIKPPGGS